jgi:alcohol dehydrogenase (cytochrome c)
LQPDNVRFEADQPNECWQGDFTHYPLVDGLKRRCVCNADGQPSSLYDNTVVFSTVPGNASSFYKGNGDGIVWALDAATGKPKWKFNTVSDGAKLWGHPKINSGGGLWYPPAVDSQGRVFISVANPAPLYGTPKYPNGSSRPGPDLYTDSLVALDGQTGKMLWHQQAIRHDLRDYDLMIPAIATTLPIAGVQTEVVLVAGKMGKAFAYRADNGRRLWTLSVGRHQNDTGPLPRKAITIYPGDLGGVETPMAFADGRLFVPWLDFGARASASGLSGGFASNFKSGLGGFTAVDAATGKVLWQHKLPSMDFGAATVANDVDVIAKAKICLLDFLSCAFASFHTALRFNAYRTIMGTDLHAGLLA